MSSKHRDRSRAAFVEDVDEDTGSVVAGTAKYATSAPSSPKEQSANIGRSRKPEGGRRPRSPVSRPYDHSDSEPSRPRGRPIGDKAEKPKRPPLQINPNPRLRQTAPHIIQSAASGPHPAESEYYGVPSSAHPDSRPPLRQRAKTSAMPRPPSFHAEGPPPRHGPPPPFGRFHNGPPPPGPQGPGPNIPTSFPPPSWYQGGGPPGPNMQHPHPPPQFQPPHVPRTPLEGPPNGYPFPPHPPHYGQPPPGPPGARGRPHSSIGHRHRQGPSYDFDAAFEPDDVEGGPPPPPTTVGRRSSVASQQRRKDARMSMPPPPLPQMRPQSARPANAVMFRPPPETPSVRTSPTRNVKFDNSDDDEDSEVEYVDARRGALEYGIPPQRALPPPPPRSIANRGHGRRPSVNDRSASYSQAGGLRNEIAKRRHSFWGPGVPEDSDENSEDDLNEKINRLRLYTGAPQPQPPPRLTQTALRRVTNRGGGSSRSTGSSESFDESEIPSHTTRTSHSNGDENGGAGVKIRGTNRGVNRIKIGGVEVELGGAEIEISASRKEEHPTPVRDDASTMYRGDDRRSRYEPPRPPMPQRAGSRAESFSRSRTAYPLATGYPPPPQYGGAFTHSPATSFPSPAGGVPELEWQPREAWAGYERQYYR